MTDLKYKIFPFYFPQFYSTQENDEWWGKGFTDWELVKAAKPIHPTQNQPWSQMLDITINPYPIQF